MSETQTSTPTIVKHWLKSKILSVMNVQSCSLTPGNALVANTWTGVIINIYLITEPVKTRAIKRLLQEATDMGIASLFILDADLIPQPDTRFEPQEWLMALHAVHHECLYLYDIDDQGPKLNQVHFEPVGSTGTHVPKYGPVVAFDKLRIIKVSVKPRYIKGDWQIADFGIAAFWRDAKIPRQTTYYRPENREFRWRAWSQTSWEQDQSYDIPAPPAAPHNRLEQSYAILNLRLDATREEVKSAFRKLAIPLHPDTSDLPPEEAADKFRALSEAYDFIKTYRNW